MSAEASPQPAALTAFLSPTSRFLTRKDDAQVAAAAVSATAVLSPADIAQKIASMLKPGPPFFSLVSSSDLIDQLGDASIMNCDFQRAAQAEAADAVSTQEAAPWTKTGTVWSALNSLPAGARFEQIPSSTPGFKKPDDDDGDDGLWSAMTISVDLDDETVHLEKSVVVPTQVLRQNHYWQGNSSSLYSDIGAGQAYEWDDFAGQQAASNNSFAGMLSLYTPAQQLWSWPSWVPFLGNEQATPGGGVKPAPAPQPSKGSKRVWVPSETRLSIHCSWWGFQLYLPPPVIAKLDGKAHSAEEIAKTIHKALSLILDKAGSLVLPLQLMAVLAVLRAISPVMGYIATFIGWSWDTIKAKDQGKGVVLAATWLLPVALIPRSWDAPTAPSDTNGDGSPDGAPIPAPEPTEPAPPAEEPVPAPAPTEPEPAPPPAPSPEQPAPTPAPAPAEPEQPKPTPAEPAPVPAPEPTQPSEPAPSAPAAEADAPIEPKAAAVVVDELAAKVEAVKVDKPAAAEASK